MSKRTERPTVAKAVTLPPENTAPVMYVGPTITGFAIQNQILSEIPEGIKAVIREHPELRNLFIPVSEYPKANRMIRERSGYIYSAFCKAQEVRR